MAADGTTLTLYQPGPLWGLPSMSPFCVKLETYLRMTGIPYRARAADFRRAPHGRIPYVRLPDGRILGDSTLIIEELKRRHGDPLDARLSPEQRARALLLQRTIECHLYFGGAWLRWKDDVSFAYVRDFLLTLLPPVVGGLILRRIRAGFLRDLESQGVGEHSREQVLEFMRQDLDALATLLGEQPYFLGAEPASIDAIAYGFLIHQLWVPWESELKAHIRSRPNLVAYCERMKSRYWAAA